MINSKKKKLYNRVKNILKYKQRKNYEIIKKKKPSYLDTLKWSKNIFECQDTL